MSSLSTKLLLTIGTIALILLGVLILQQSTSSQDRAESAPRSDNGATETPSLEDEAAKYKLTLPGRPGTALSILFIGDSISLGAFASTDEKAFPALMTSYIGRTRDASREVVAAGGATTEEITRKLPSQTRAQMAVVEVGLNDGGRGTPLNKLRSDYALLLQKIRFLQPQMAILCVGPWGIPEDQVNTIEIEKEECGKINGKFVNIADLYQDPRNRGPSGQRARTGGLTDNSHPNDRGHAEIANRLGLYVNGQ